MYNTSRKPHYRDKSSLLGYASDIMYTLDIFYTQIVYIYRDYVTLILSYTILYEHTADCLYGLSLKLVYKVHFVCVFVVKAIIPKCIFV